MIKTQISPKWPPRASYINPPLELIFCSRNNPNTIGGGHANLAVLRNHHLDLAEVSCRKTTSLHADREKEEESK